ncbi:MAG TPA: hypothetical protein VMW29_00220 [Candidatus Bathyarchaeia archaeon]|nr:hypothetical protein [Candidatus Bathyarchaeia archaeon]
MGQVAVTKGTNKRGERLALGVDPETERTVFIVEGTGSDTRGAYRSVQDIVPGHDVWEGMAASEKAAELLHERMAEHGARLVGGEGAVAGSTFGWPTTGSSYEDIFGHS